MKVIFTVDPRRAPAGVLVEIQSLRRAAAAKKEVEGSGGYFTHPAVLRWDQVEPHLPVGTFERLESGITATVNIPDSTCLSWFGFIR